MHEKNYRGQYVVLHWHVKICCIVLGGNYPLRKLWCLILHCFILPVTKVQCDWELNVISQSNTQFERKASEVNGQTQI